LGNQLTSKSNFNQPQVTVITWWPEYRQHLSYIASEHGWSDDIIPPEHSIRFAKEAGCTLHLIDGDHRLKGAIEMVEDLFGRFLCRVLSGKK